MSIFEYDEEEYTRLTLEKGREQGRIANLLQNIQSLIETMDWTAEQAMDALKISEHDHAAIKPFL